LEHGVSRHVDEFFFEISTRVMKTVSAIFSRLRRALRSRRTYHHNARPFRLAFRLVSDVSLSRHERERPLAVLARDARERRKSRTP